MTYAYRCPNCGGFDVTRPMGAAEVTEPCPRCGVTGTRIFTSPALAGSPGPLQALRGREEASRDDLAVVSRVPPARQRRRSPPHPAWSRLPRP
ncbi:MAG: FmdB family zinc ribbon protein [Mycobacterium leprae]